MTGQQLKNSILQLAVQGKLVPQDPNDEPASVLLERIRAEKEQLIKEGKIKKEKNPSYIYRGEDGRFYESVGKNAPVCIDEELPFEIPETWEWARLQELSTKIGSGSTPTGGKAVYVTTGIKFIRSQNVYNDGLYLNDIAYIPDEINAKKPNSIVQAKDILLNITGGSIGRCAIVPDDFDIANINQHVMIIRQINPVLRFWIHSVLISTYIQDLIMDVQVGVSREGLSATKLKAFLMPIPPLAEQKRIVAKIEELMPFVDRYDKLEKQLQALNTTFPDQLKKSILQYAIQGKLVHQDPTDEPANTLLERIRAEKAQLIKDGKIKREKNPSQIFRGEDGHFYERIGKNEPVCIDEELPFEIPESWEWARFDAIATFLNGDRGKNYPHKDEYTTDGIAWINTGHIQKNGSLDISSMNYISPEKFNSLRSGKIQRGDLLYCLRGATFGKTAKIEPFKEGAIASSLMIIRFFDLSLRDYIFYYLRSDFAYQQLHLYNNGSAQPNLAAKDVKKYLIPLPPLAEQQRIVDKIEQLDTYINQLPHI